MTENLLSICVLTYNEELHLRRLLSQLTGLNFRNEIIVVDSFSKDATLQIAESFASVKIVKNVFENFSAQRNFAISQAQGDWILMIDADEMLSVELISFLQEGGYRQNPAVDLYQIPRKNFFLSRFLSHTYPDYQARLFRNQGLQFSKGVHETIHVEDSRQRQITMPLEHLPLIPLRETFEKMQKYTDLEAETPVEISQVELYFRLSLFPWLLFLRNYFINEAFKDGAPGLVWVGCNCYYVFMKYAKIFEKQIKQGGQGGRV